MIYSCDRGFTVLVILRWILGNAGWTEGQVNIESWYFKITFDIVFLLMKYKIFLKSKRNLHTSQKLLFQFQKTSSYLVKFAYFPPNLCLLLFRSPTLSISIVSFSSNLKNRLNALSAFHKLEPIGNAQSLSLGFIYQNHTVEINTASQQH